VYPSYADEAYRIHFFFGDEIEEIKALTPRILKSLKFERLTIYPANMFVTSPDVLQNAIWEINKI
jgi:excinuclease ABC subunit B